MPTNYAIHDIVISKRNYYCLVKSDQRLGDERFWEKEVDDKLGVLKQETDALDMYRNRLNAAIEAYEEPLRIAQLCLANRSALLTSSLLHTCCSSLPSARLSGLSGG